MPIYEFTLHLMPTGLASDAEFELFDSKLCQQCSDALLVSYQGVCFLNFMRIANNEHDAVISAVNDIRRAGFYVVEEGALEQVRVSYILSDKHDALSFI